MGNQTVSVNFKAIDNITAPMRNATKSIQSFTQRSKAAIKSLRTELNKVNSQLGGFGRNLPMLGGLSLAGAVMGGKSAIEKFAEREAMEKTISFVSGKDAAKNLAFIRKNSNDLAVSLKASFEGFTKFSASMLGSKFTMQQTRDMFSNVSTALRVFGVDTEGTASVFRAMGEMVSKGKIQAQELRQQLANVLPGTQKHLADSMGKSMAKIDKMLQNGAINTKKYLQAFTEQLYKVTKEGLPAALETTSAELQRLENSWEDTMYAIGGVLAQSGVVTAIKDVAISTENWVKANKEVAGSFATDAVEGAKEFGKYIITNGPAIIDTLKGVAIAIATIKIAIFTMSAITALTSPVTWVLAMAGAIGLALGEVKNIREELKAGRDDLAWYAGFSTGFDNLIYGKKGNSWWDDLKKQFYGLLQILLGVYNTMWKIVSLIGVPDSVVDYFTKGSKEYIAQLDELAQTGGGTKGAMTSNAIAAGEIHRLANAKIRSANSIIDYVPATLPDHRPLMFQDVVPDPQTDRSAMSENRDPIFNIILTEKLKDSLGVSIERGIETEKGERN